MGGNMTRGRIFASATKVANYNPTEIGSKRLTLSPKKKKKTSILPKAIGHGEACPRPGDK